MIPLGGKTALITGGSRGIGLAIAHALAKQDVSTILIGRNPDTLHSAVRSIQAATATQTAHHAFVQGDVGLAKTWQDLMQRLETGDLEGPAATSSGGARRISVLVNCAGVAQKSLLVKTAPGDVDALLDANLKSAVLGCRYVGAQMIRSAAAHRRSSRAAAASSTAADAGAGGGGETSSRGEDAGLSIINVSSVMASRGGLGASVYAASKAGVLGLTSALALEYGQLGIRVNALVPGYIKTEMTENLDQNGLRKSIPLGRVGQAEEVAEAAVFLAQNAYANNCVLTIDGGLTAGFSTS